MNPISFRKSCISSVVMPAISCFPKAGNTCARKCFLQVSIEEGFSWFSLYTPIHFSAYSEKVIDCAVPSAACPYQQQQACRLLLLI